MDFFNWRVDETIPALLDPNALLRTKIFRSDQNHQLLEADESAIDPMHSRYGKDNKYFLYDWHTVSFNGLRFNLLLTI